MLLARIEGEPMRFEVPAGSALVFSDQNGQLLAEPESRPTVRTVRLEPEV